MKRKLSLAFCLSFLAIGLLAHSVWADTYTPYETVAFQLIGDAVTFNNDSFLQRYNGSGSTDAASPAFWYKVGAGSWNQVNDGNITINGQNGQILYLGMYPASAQSSAPWIQSADGTGGAQTWPNVSNGLVIGDGLGVSFDTPGKDIFIDWDTITFSSGNVNWTIRSTETSITFTQGSLAPVPIPAAAWLLGTGLVGLVALKRRKKK